MYNFAEDNLEPEYWDLEQPTVSFANAKYGIDVYIDHSHGYAGFESLLGEKLFPNPQAPKRWSGYEFKIKKGSEHTVNGKRFDVEL